MDSAKNSRAALVQRVARLAQNAGGADSLNYSKIYSKGEACKTENLSEKAKEYIEKFQAALENDLSAPVALSCIQKAVKDGSLKPEESLELVRRMDSVIGLNLVKSAADFLAEQEKEQKASVPDHSGDPEAQEIDALVAERVEAKKAKNFARADEIRNMLSSRGIIITDTPNGAVWKRS